MKNKRKLNKENLIALIIAIILVMMLIVSTISVGLLASMLKGKPKVTIDKFESNQSTQIFDANGELIGSVGNQIRTNVTYDKLPQSLIDALVSIEDSRYFSHNGFDIARFTKSALNNIKSMSFSQGGSTLTMQLIKNTYFVDDEAGLSAQKKISRKLQEIFMSFDVNKILSKERAIELYLNKLNFGGSGNIRGIQTAAQYYFGKDVQELTLPESAMLVGIVNSPKYYNPFRYLDYATERRDTVLNLMHHHGYITKKELNLAKSVKVEDLLVKDGNKSFGNLDQYQAYIDTVVEEAKNLTGLDPYSTPMKIYTYMDQPVQKVIDNIQAGNVDGYFEYPDELVEIAVVSMNNSNGQINAVGGGRNYASGGSLLLNHATDQYKQPGSSVKPFLSYALAFEILGWNTNHVIVDRPYVYRGTSKVIKNYSGRYVGDVILKDAVGQSLNIPAIVTLQEVIDNVGSKHVVSYLQNLGFSKVTRENFDLGFSIGGSNFEANAVELAGAHATMINAGDYIKPHTISKIEFLDGSEPIEAKYTPVNVLSKEAAYIVSDLMYNNVYGPYTNYMSILRRDYPVYAKTGTTDWGNEGLDYGIPQGAAKDQWLIASTSKYTVSVWVGYEKAIKDKDTYFTVAKERLNTRGKIAKLVLDANEMHGIPEAIHKPDGVIQLKHILGTYPYASPIEGMDEKFVVTSLIKKDFANLVDPQSASVEQLNNLDVTLDAAGNVQIKFPVYPDASKLEIAPEHKDISLNEGGKYVEAYGKRIFDWTWVYGRILYKGKITINNNVVHEFNSESETYNSTIALQPGQLINVCGYYGYGNLEVNSNQVCREFTIEDKDITFTVPNNKATRTDIETFAQTYGITTTFTEVIDASKKDSNEIYNSGVLVNGQTLTLKQSELPRLTLTVYIYKAPACGENAELVNGVCTCLVGYEGDPKVGCKLKTLQPDSSTPSNP